MKKIFAILLALCMGLAIMPVTASAATELASGTCGDNLHWVVDSDYCLTISGSGPMYDYAEGTAPWSAYKDTLYSIYFYDGTTYIGDYAFDGMSEIRMVTFGKGLTEIGDYAFRNCTLFMDMYYMPDTVIAVGKGAFLNCAELNYSLSSGLETIGDSAFEGTYSSNVSLPASVKTVGNRAFANCFRLSMVKIPKTVVSIGAEAFSDCTALTEIFFDGEAPSIGENAFAGDVATVFYQENCSSWTNEVRQNYGGTLTYVSMDSPLVTRGDCGQGDDQLTWILTENGTLTISGTGRMDDFNRYAMNKDGELTYAIYWDSYFDQIKTLVVEEGVTYIGDHALYMAPELTSVTFPDSLTEIGDQVFAGCSKLTTIHWGKGLTETGIEVFLDCDSLTAVTLPQSDVGYGRSIFSGCDNLTSIIIPETQTSISETMFRNCKKLTQIDLPDSITKIGGKAFEGSGLTSINIPDSVTILGQGVFYNCDSLTKVEIPGSVSTISPEMFYSCDSLTTVIFNEGTTEMSYGILAYANNVSEITIPSTVTKLVRTFEYAYGLETVTFLGDAPEMSEQTFDGVTATVYYPRNRRTWTEDKLQNYGGTLTWEPYGIACTDHSYEAAVTEPTCSQQGFTTYTCTICGDSYVDNYTDPVDHSYEDGNCKWCGKVESYVKWSSISTSLGGNIAMNFYVELSEDLVSDPDAYIQFTFAGRTLKVALSDGKPSDKNGVTVYQFSCPITSKNMTDEITAQVYNGSGKVGEPKSMSVDTYCNWVIANFKDEKTVNLMKGMLNYGASAQKLFNYRTDALANATLAEEDKVFGAVDASAYKHTVTGTEEGIITKSMTLLLDSETTVRVYFELTGDKTIDQYTFTVDGVEVQPTFKDGKYYIERPNISAHRLDDMHVFTCGGITVTYGGLSYVNQVMTYYTEGATFEMASALYAYSKAAEAYIG